MSESTHPHLAPRQPRHNAEPGTNPPVFAWKPAEDQTRFELLVARDESFSALSLHQTGLTEPVFLPETALDPGTYFWKWRAGDEESSVHSFTIQPNAATVEVPGAEEWMARFGHAHPRVLVRGDEIEPLRAAFAQDDSETKAQLLQSAAELLAESHEIEEPSYLPDSTVDYDAFFRTWYPIMWNSRKFVKGAETLALAHLLTGEQRYARAACQRMASISRWDADGSSFVEHNSEAHMSVIWHGPKACDWVWHEFTDEERALVVAQFRARGENQLKQLRDSGYYGITRFDSHSERKIVFLAMTALVFYDEIPEAKQWLAWVRPLLCGIWPIWGEDDGAWAQGISYSLAYVTIMTMFVTTLKHGAGINLYNRPFWRNHLDWRRYCLPSYAQWYGFGDHSERWEETWRNNANLVETILRGVDQKPDDTSGFAEYIEAFRTGAAHNPSMPERQMPGINTELYLEQLRHGELSVDEGSAVGGETQPQLRLFPQIGWAAVRTDLTEPTKESNDTEATDDIALIFRSSPYGAISHSHANNNDFIIHVAGQVMAMPSGYYDGYGSNHHANWVWHTKSHNCVTLSGAGQIMRSPRSTGAIEHAYEDERLLYFRGNADASYQDRAEICRRHVLFLKGQRSFVMVDQFVAKADMTSALEWNIHSWSPFEVDEAARTFTLQRNDSRLHGQFLYHRNSFFTLSEGWDPPPGGVKQNELWYNQYNLRFTTGGYADRRTVGVVLRPEYPGWSPPPLGTERSDGAEIAQIGGDRVLINEGEGMTVDGQTTHALIVAQVAGQLYTVDDTGIKT